MAIVAQDYRHSLLGASGAHRWLRCAGAPVMEQGAVDESSMDADDGTASHALASTCLDLGLDTDAFLDEAIHVLDIDGNLRSEWEVDEARADYVQGYVDRCRAVLHEMGGHLHAEYEVDFSTPLGLPIGTAVGCVDCLLVQPQAKRITVRDLKYGFRHVDAEENYQLRLYAVGAICGLMSHHGEMLDWEVVMDIDMPRRGYVGTEVLSVEELMAWAAEMRPAAEDAHHAIAQYGITGDQPLDLLHPHGDACYYCRAKSYCPAYETYALSAVTLDLDFDDMPATVASSSIPSAERLDALEEYVKTMRARIVSELKSGADVHGWKLVHGRKPHRKWSDESAVADVVKRSRLKQADAYETKLRSPAQLMGLKALRGTKYLAELEALVAQGDAPLVAVGEADPRERVTVNIDDEFNDLTLETDNG